MLPYRYVVLGICCAALFTLVHASICSALQPEEVLVIANKKARASVGLAEHYMEKRGVPEENLVQIWVDAQEHCSRKAYEEKIVPPVQRFLQKNEPGERIRCLLLMYGVPLKAAGPPASEAEKKAMLLPRANK